VDINSAVGRAEGITEEQLRELCGFRKSGAFSATEKAALTYAEEMTRTPVDVADAVFQELRRFFDDRQIVELTSAIALENLRARFAHALDLPSDGLCELPADHPVRRAIAGAPVSEAGGRAVEGGR